jgi:hypothetical protein
MHRETALGDISVARRGGIRSSVVLVLFRVLTGKSGTGAKYTKP